MLLLLMMILYDTDAVSMKCTTVAQRHRGDVIVTSSRPLHGPPRRPNSPLDLHLSATGYRLLSSASSWPQPGLVLALPCLTFVISRFCYDQPLSLRKRRMHIY